MWITLTLRYWKPLAAILLMVTLYGYGYLRGMDSVQAEWDKAQLRAAQNNLKINAEVSNDYQKKIADLRKRYDAIRLRSAGGVRIPHAPGRPDAASGANRLPWEVAGPAGDLMYQADVNTQRLISLQEWVKRQE